MPVMVKVIVSVVMNALTASAMPRCRELGSKTIFKLKKGSRPKATPQICSVVFYEVLSTTPVTGVYHPVS